MEDRFTYTTDPEIGVPGYYRHNEDGSVDTTVRYKFVDDTPDDPDDPTGHFEPHEHQYARVEFDPASVVPLEAHVNLGLAAEAGGPPAPDEPEEEDGGFMGRLLGR